VACDLGKTHDYIVNSLQTKANVCLICIESIKKTEPVSIVYILQEVQNNNSSSSSSDNNYNHAHGFVLWAIIIIIDRIVKYFSWFCLSLSLSILTVTVSGGPELVTKMSPFQILLELRMMEMVVTSGAGIRLQSST